MQLFLIRHPRPLIAAGLCYGQLDVDCEDPQPLAEQLALALPAATPVFSSPLRRARRLALALDPQATADARLCEISFGAWEGQPWDSIARPALDASAADSLLKQTADSFGMPCVDPLRTGVAAIVDRL